MKVIEIYYLEYFFSKFNQLRLKNINALVIAGTSECTPEGLRDRMRGVPPQMGHAEANAGVQTSESGCQFTEGPIIAHLHSVAWKAIKLSTFYSLALDYADTKNHFYVNIN